MSYKKEIEPFSLLWEKGKQALSEEEA